MKHNTTLLFFSPVPWSFGSRHIYHNKQIVGIARYLAKKYNVLYLDPTRLQTFSIRALVTSPQHRRLYMQFLDKLKNSQQTVIHDMYFISFPTTLLKKLLKPIDDILLVGQLYVYIYLSSRKLSCIAWAHTLYFPALLKRCTSIHWFFDFFDRQFDFSNREQEALLRKNERWLFSHARRIFVNSTFHFDFATYVRGTLHLEAESKVVYTPVGYLLHSFIPHFPRMKKNPIVMGFAGTISERIDYNLIYEVIRRHKDISFVFIGPIYEHHGWISSVGKQRPKEFIEKIKLLKNVSLIPSTSSQKKLITVMSSFTISWMPYDTTLLFNRFCTPTKFFEYCALGLPIVSTAIPSLEDYKNKRIIIYTQRDFGRAVHRALRLRSRRNVLDRKKLAFQHDIRNKMNVVMQEISNVVDKQHLSYEKT